VSHTVPSEVAGVDTGVTGVSLLPLAPTAILVGLSPPSAAHGCLGICRPPTLSSGTRFSPSVSGFTGFGSRAGS
jgi:hypothetical protein